MYVRIFAYIYERFFYIYKKNAQKTAQGLSGLSGFLDSYAQNLASKWAVWAVFERFI